MFKIARFSLLIIMLFALTGCSLNKPKVLPVSGEVNPYDDQAISQIGEKFNQNLSISAVQAQTWQSDVYLAGFNAKLFPGANLTNLTQTFVYGSAKDTFYWWTISIDPSGKFVRALIPKEDYLGQDLKPIQTDYLKYNIAQILNTSESSIGAQFTSDNPQTEIYLVLEQSQPNNWLWWVVSYRSPSSSQNVRINAFDGKIYNDFGELQN